jgi:uncharacterized protein YbaP (TraB family)
VKRREFLLAAAALHAWPAAAAPAGKFSKGLLWRVTRKGVAPSFVYGTIHAADPRLAVLPAPVVKAFQGATSLMLEYLADDYARERFLEAAIYMDRRTLEDEIGTRDFELAVERMKATGLSRDFVKRLKPWGVLINLRTTKLEGGPSLDARLLEMARARRMPLHQIENVEEQIFTFDEFPMESQVALLRHTLAHEDDLIALNARTMDAYVERDLAALWRLREEFSNRHPEMARHHAVMTKRVVLDRSVVMAFRMQRTVRHGNAFVALGALHLYGEKGVLALLEDDGYRVARVY